MTNISANLSLPYIQPSQAQKHVTHNEGMRILDTLTQLAVQDTSLTTPPTTVAPGDCFLVAPTASGAWVGQEAKLAVWDENAWTFYDPQPGWTAWNIAIGQQITWDGSAWIPSVPNPSFQNLPMVGINTTADATNRLAVSSDAVLLTHDSSGDQRLKLNKANSTHTASLLFQTNWQGHAEMGLAGNNDFSLKTSADGTTFQTSLQADHITGAVSFPSGVTGMTNSAFGAETLITSDYIASKGVDLVVNGTGLLGNNYNYPTDFQFDPVSTPNLPGAVYYAGYYSWARSTTEFLPVDPNQVYRMSCYLQQEALPGSWGSYANEDRHSQYMGLLTFDVDKNQISADHHMRFKAGGVDSLTTLTAPLTPGDTEIFVTDATGWNDTNANQYYRGVTIFEYQNSLGGTYAHYSRLVGFDLFDLSGVDKTLHKITLNQPFPSSLGNPDDPNGTWPTGSKIANASSGSTFKYSLFSNLILPQSGTWFHAKNHMGGIDLSGENTTHNFPPGTAFVKVFWLPNFSNQAGGAPGFPDTGVNHRILFSGISITPDMNAATFTEPNGSVSLKAPQPDYASGVISLNTTGLSLTPL